jgi:Cu+-exporting ATPase
MTCGACTAAIESAFDAVDGVGTVSVSLVMGRAVVAHDAIRISAETVRQIIEDRGFDAEVLSTDVPSDSADELIDADERMAGDESAQAVPLSITTLAVEGMTCGACTSAVESAFKDVPGAHKVNVSLLSERAVVEHDPAVLSSSRIAELIEDRGFGASVLESKTVEPSTAPRRLGGAKLMTTTVAIEGMTCGACTSAVEKAFNGVDGVAHFNISLLAERAVVVHDPSKLSTENIIRMYVDSCPSDRCLFFD